MLSTLGVPNSIVPAEPRSGWLEETLMLAIRSRKSRQSDKAKPSRGQSFLPGSGAELEPLA